MLSRVYDQLVILADLGIWMGIWNWLDWVMGSIYGCVPWWRTTLAGLGRWDWLMGTGHGDVWLDRGDRIDLWGHAIGAHNTGWIGWWDWFMGTCDTGWIGVMGLLHGGTRHRLDRGDGIASWGLAMGTRGTGWIGAMGLIYGGVPWGCAARAGSGRWDRFMGMPHGGARLDRGDGIDWWGCAMGARDTGWIRDMG